MTKEYLEALDGLFDLVTCQDTFEKAQKFYYIIEEALQRLESIENVKFSEALNCLESMLNEKALFRSILSRSTARMDGEQIDEFSDKSTIGNKFKGAISIIKQALLKAQEMESENKALLEENKDLYFELALAEKQYKELTECAKQQEKVLSVIKEKEVNMQVFNQCEDVETYNKVYIKQKDRQLTEEEFELLKKWAERQKTRNNKKG